MNINLCRRCLLFAFFLVGEVVHVSTFVARPPSAVTPTYLSVTAASTMREQNNLYQNRIRWFPETHQRRNNGNNGDSSHAAASMTLHMDVRVRRQGVEQFATTDENSNIEDDDGASTKNKRDRIREWMSGVSESKPMVRPIRLDGQIDDTPAYPPRIRANFDSFFAGMPTMEEILSGGINQLDPEEEESDDDDDDGDDASRRGQNAKSRKAVDDSWFDEERKMILANYDEICKDMLNELKNERSRDPKSVPDNAEALTMSILKQEMDTEINETRQKRLLEMLDAYQRGARWGADTSDVSLKQLTPSAQRLMDESEAEYAQQVADRRDVEDYERYEQTVQTKSKKRDYDDSSYASQRPLLGENLDQWALDRLKDMMKAREDSDGDEMILDILQDNVAGLESSIKKSGERLPFTQAKTMKELQMYRSIASRLENNDNDDDLDVELSRKNEIFRDELIMSRLDSWKDYIAKEEQSRIKSGLARGPKLPFAWQESREDASLSRSPVVANKESRIEARKLVNRMSIEAMESLLAKSDDARREKLQKEIDYLKSTLELTDYLDIDESAFDIATDPGPVDTTNLFKTYSSSNFEAVTDTSDRLWDSTPSNSEPVTSSFSPELQSSSSESFTMNERPIPPPNTPFFADTDESTDDGVTFAGDSRLGNMEEQKLEAMFRRAGAKTAKERATIRSEWEAFRDFEKDRRQQSGLGGDSEDVSSLLSENLKYNVSAVMKEDGDFDAEAILASIGPRPVRKSLSPNPTADAPRTVDKKEVMDSLYRTVSAVGGGRYRDDPLAKAQQRASYQEFMEKESEMRELLDGADTTEYIDSIDDLPSPTDDQFYAEEVLSALGPRPKPKRVIVMDAGDFSDQGGLLADIDDDEDDDDEDDDDDEAFSSDRSDEDFSIPEWLRKENAEVGKRGGVRKTFLGSDIDDVFDDTDYELNARQLAEYEKRRAGKSRQMGIDISEVLGRNSARTNDYADFQYDNEFLRRPGGSTQSFSARKGNLLDYIELDVRELNALMDHKDSVYSTGVSQYLPRINKPFKDFGAIFRLEGSLLDVNGLQFKAWIKVAEENKLKMPLYEDVQLASVARPEMAVKDIFFWTDDFIECRRLAASHRTALKEVFTAWAKQNGIVIPETDGTGSAFNVGMVIDDDDNNRVTSATAAPKLSETERVEAVKKAWTITAGEYGKEPPVDEMYFVAVSLSPDIAVTKAFGWSSDPLEVDRMVSSFRRNLGANSGETSKRETLHTGTVASKPRSQNDVMELHYQAWSAVADTFGFNAPETDEVLAAFVINEPEIAARGFGWSDDSSMLRDIVEAFNAKLDFLMNDGRSGEKETNSNKVAPPKHAETSFNNDDLFKAALNAWNAVANISRFPEPDYEQVQFAMSVGPEEAIINGFEWAVNPYEVTKLVKMYRDELARQRSSWQNNMPSSQPSASSSSNSIAVKPSGPSQDEVYRAVFEAWTAVAFMSGYLAVDDEQVQFAMSVGPEEAIVNGFGWTDDRATITEIVTKYKTEISKRRSKWELSAPSTSNSAKSEEMPLFQVKPDTNKWVKSLLDVEMQCSIVSYLEREQVDVLLQLSGLDQLFPPDKRVTASNGYLTDKDQLLGAALRAERRPDHCVVFDSSPQASLAAHDVEMQSVCLIGPYPRYELLSADTTAASLEALTAVNIRRLFSERVSDQPMADIQQIEPEKRRTTRTRFFEDS